MDKYNKNLKMILVLFFLLLTIFSFCNKKQNQNFLEETQPTDSTIIQSDQLISAEQCKMEENLNKLLQQIRKKEKQLRAKEKELLKKEQLLSQKQVQLTKSESKVKDNATMSLIVFIIGVIAITVGSIMIIFSNKSKDHKNNIVA